MLVYRAVVIKPVFAIKSGTSMGNYAVFSRVNLGSEYCLISITYLQRTCEDIHQYQRWNKITYPLPPVSRQQGGKTPLFSFLNRLTTPKTHWYVPSPCKMGFLILFLCQHCSCNCRTGVLAKSILCFLFSATPASLLWTSLPASNSPTLSRRRLTRGAQR